jgi:molecular chaperone GrpE
MSDHKPKPSSAEKPSDERVDLSSDAVDTILGDVESLRAKALERDQYLDLLKRTQADFENYQKRNQREREQEWRYRTEGLSRDLLGVIDNLERALDAAEQGKDSGPLVKGVSMVVTQFLDLLKRHGVTPIEVQLGQAFDPNVHQAVMQKPTGDVPPNSVAQVFQRGFMLHDRVLRPASVVVAVAP